MTDNEKLIWELRETAGKIEGRQMHVSGLLRRAADALERDGRDAVRYRWLRDNPRAYIEEAGRFYRVGIGGVPQALGWSESAGAAIDTAMRAEGGES